MAAAVQSLRPSPAAQRACCAVQATSLARTPISPAKSRSGIPQRGERAHRPRQARSAPVSSDKKKQRIDRLNRAGSPPDPTTRLYFSSRQPQPIRYPSNEGPAGGRPAAAPACASHLTPRLSARKSGGITTRPSTAHASKGPDAQTDATAYTADTALDGPPNRVKRNAAIDTDPSGTARRAGLRCMRPDAHASQPATHDLQRSSPAADTHPSSNRTRHHDPDATEPTAPNRPEVTAFSRDRFPAAPEKPRTAGRLPERCVSDPPPSSCHPSRSCRLAFGCGFVSSFRSADRVGHGHAAPFTKGARDLHARVTCVTLCVTHGCAAS